MTPDLPARSNASIARIPSPQWFARNEVFQRFEAECVFAGRSEALGSAPALPHTDEVFKQRLAAT
jgi:hypothetical protein